MYYSSEILKYKSLFRNSLLRLNDVAHKREVQFNIAAKTKMKKAVEEAKMELSLESVNLDDRMNEFLDK